METGKNKTMPTVGRGQDSTVGKARTLRKVGRKGVVLSGLPLLGSYDFRRFHALVITLGGGSLIGSPPWGNGQEQGRPSL